MPQEEEEEKLPQVTEKPFLNETGATVDTNMLDLCTITLFLGGLQGCDRAAVL